MVLLVYAFQLLQILSTGWVTITIEIAGQKENEVTLFTPINDSLFLPYSVGTNVSKQAGSKMHFKVPFSGSSFFMLKVNGETRIPLALKGGDSIHIHVTRKPKNQYVACDLKFSGANAEAHSVYQKRFFPPGRNFGYFSSLADKSNDLDAYFIKSKVYVDSLTNVWDSLKQKALLDPAIYQLYMADTRGGLYDEAIVKFAKVLKKDSSAKTYIQRQHIKLAFFHYSEANNSMLLKTQFGKQLYHTYLSNVINRDPTVMDKRFLSSDYKHYYYYDSASRELAWGGFFMHIKENFPSLALTESDLSLYRSYHPNSALLKRIDNFNDSLLQARAVLKIPTKIDSTQYRSLGQLLSKVKERYVFVDVWATWCMPCIAEFSYLPSISKFLQSKSIAQAFLSIDKASDKDKWKVFIQKNTIPGYHFFGNDKIETDLLKIFAKESGEAHLFIPRYFIYDREKDKYYVDLPKPSTGKVLEQAILDIIQ